MRNGALAQQGIRRQRAEADCGTVIVVAGDHYGLVAMRDSEDVFILLGAEPAPCLRVDPAEVRRRYELPRADDLPRTA